jgi:hypothetical protein
VVGPPPSVTTSDAVDPDALAAITIGVERILQFWANP